MVRSTFSNRPSSSLRKW